MILDDILVNLKQRKKSKAYTYKKVSYSYDTFYQFVCNIYNMLIMKNPNKLPVIVYGHKEVYMKATFLACSFAGMAYVPIDESMPIDRINRMVNQVSPQLIIGNLEIKNYKNITVKQIDKVMNNSNFKEIDTIYMKPQDSYYIIFTSGSTGIPKGVKITYENIDSCVKWLKEVTEIKKGVILNQANFSFDLSVADMYLSLVSGSEHYIMENENKADFLELFKELSKSNVTMAVMTPTFMDLLLLDPSFNDKLMPNLKTLIFCGEKLLKNTVEKIKQRFKEVRIINSYGPTECTFAVTSMEITKSILELDEIPVGKVKDDCQIVIVDKDGNCVKDEEIGEILIIGKSVANGYVEDNRKNQFIRYNNQKAYLTGDLGYIKEGILYYKSRKDKQVKYKGYRIELSDIEKNIQTLPYIEKVVVIAKQDKDNKISKLIAFIKIKQNIEKRVVEIKEDIRKKMPEYMCPMIKIVEDFPINQNGKCDEKKLLEEY